MARANLVTGPVSSYLADLLRRQVNQNDIVVWYDPDHFYRDFVEGLQQDDATIARYKDGFFRLRHEIDDLLEGDSKPRLVVYVPLEHTQTRNALIELETNGVVLKPGQHPWQLNTRPSHIAKRALESDFAAKDLQDIEAKVEQGSLTLQDLDQLVLAGPEEKLLPLIYGTQHTKDIVRAFLLEERPDADLEQRAGAREELKGLLERVYGFQAEDHGLGDLREAFVRFLFVTELMHAFSTDRASLTSMPHAVDPRHVREVHALLEDLRKRSEAQTDYVRWAMNTEAAIGAADLEIPVEALRVLETLPVVENRLQALAEQGIMEDPTQWVALAEARRDGFWAKVDVQIHVRWGLIHLAGRLIQEAERTLEWVRRAEPDDVKEFVEAYVEGDRPLCLVDTLHRQLEHLWQRLDASIKEENPRIVKLIGAARKDYTEAADTLARAFVERLEAGSFQITSIPHQRRAFADQVDDLLGKGPVAYVWVDAMRFELARDFLRSLSTDFKVDLRASIASVPTITEIGMSSLLPRAEGKVSVIPAGKGKLALVVDGVELRDRADRIRFLERRYGTTFASAKMHEILDGKGIHAKKAPFLLVTSQELDAVGESGDVRRARREMQEIQEDLVKLMPVLARRGYQHIVLTADHGYLFGRKIDDADKIDAPGGETKDLHRRCWVGLGGRTPPGCLRAPLQAFGMDSELDLVVPRGTAVFKAPGGNDAFFHGGLSPQELIVPMAIITPTMERKHAEPGTGIQWRLELGAKRITSRYCSLQVSGELKGVLPGSPLPRLRVVARLDGEVVGQTVSTSYGEIGEDGSVEAKPFKEDPSLIQPNTITLLIDTEKTTGELSFTLLDAVTQRQLAKLDKVPLDLAI